MLKTSHIDTLLPPLTAEAAEYLERYPELLERVYPLKRKHRAALPDAIGRLSRALTSERGERPSDYLRDPALLGAYLYYFLPWNLYRLTRLFTGLREPLLAMLPEESTIVDAGSGPLTTVQALWLALPERREAAWSVNCMDLAGKAMKIGRDLLDLMAGGRAAWKVRLVQKPAPGGVRDLPKRYDLLVAANLLNELATSRDDSPGAAVVGRLGPLLERAKSGALLIEPGTRLGGTMVAHARDTSQERGFVPIAPCPGPSVHAASEALFPCAVLGARGRGQAWCHFKAAASGAPAWLEKLTKQAGFGREDVSLSFVLLAAGEVAPHEGERMEARVLSNAFALGEGGLRDAGAYACTPRGLVLLRASKRSELPTQGSRVTIAPPRGPERDPKSGAPVADIGEGS
jgi:ribosomal protein RSM22 (predicted rRNA methylase)